MNENAPTWDGAERLAARLKGLRQERVLSLDGLAAQTGISRATLSRLENGGSSPTAAQLAALCSAFGLTMSRLMHLVEEGFAPVIRRADQAAWADPERGVWARPVSPPAASLLGEVVEWQIAPGATIRYETAPMPGREHHLVMMEGSLELELGETREVLSAGDCCRYRLHGRSAFTGGAPDGGRYLLMIIGAGQP
ncbi:MAG: XRE family transcriptional regulator [Pseudomonadota bacterium]